MSPITFAVFCFIVVSWGCDRATPITPVSPTSVAVAASPLPPPVDGPSTSWRGEATVVARTGSGGCGWGTTVGETRTNVYWSVTIGGNAVRLNEDMANYPDHIAYAGTIADRQFTATYSEGDDYLRWVCQFKGATLSGSFSADFSSFEADETLVWGAPGAETTVQRRWRATRF